MSADIVVVGAGIIGGSIAWRLSQAGLRVTLLDAGTMGAEASWAGAGMLAPGGEIERRSSWSDFALQSLRLYPAFVQELSSESGTSIDYRQAGAVEIATDDAEWKALSHRARLQGELGIPSTPLGASELRDVVPLLERPIAGALLFPEDGLVDPRHVTRALRTCCVSRGVQIHEHARVSAIRLSTNSVSAETGAGTFTAAAIVLAAGAWSSQIPVIGNGTPGNLPESFPLRGHLLGYHLPAGSLGPILRHRQTYLLQRSGGFTIAGTSVERVGFDRTLDQAALHDIAVRAGELIPRLAAAAPPEAWLGFRPGTNDLQPEIRRWGDSPLWLAYGHYRNGILLAPATARRITREITTSSGMDLPSTAGNV